MRTNSIWLSAAKKLSGASDCNGMTNFFGASKNQMLAMFIPLHFQETLQEINQTLANVRMLFNKPAQINHHQHSQQNKSANRGPTKCPRHCHRSCFYHYSTLSIKQNNYIHYVP